MTPRRWPVLDFEVVAAFEDCTVQTATRARKYLRAALPREKIPQKGFDRDRQEETHLDWIPAQNVQALTAIDFPVVLEEE